LLGHVIYQEQGPEVSVNRWLPRGSRGGATTGYRCEGDTMTRHSYSQEILQEERDELIGYGTHKQTVQWLILRDH